MIMIVLIMTACASGSKIEGVSDDVYARGLEFIAYLDDNKMVGETEGEQMLNAISPEGAPDSDALFEDVIYILWVYHNLKCVDTAAEDLNASWAKLGVETTVQEEYQKCHDSILSARTQQDLWDIWNSV
jgi:hypothetical protein